jgi:hypothetical protein
MCHTINEKAKPSPTKLLGGKRDLCHIPIVKSRKSEKRKIVRLMKILKEFAPN